MPQYGIILKNIESYMKPYRQDSFGDLYSAGFSYEAQALSGISIGYEMTFRFERKCN